MKALIREDEIITEPWSQWVEDHLDWLTASRPDGDGYKLIENYEPPEIEPEISGNPLNI
jgi:hypothetical protein